MSLTIRSPKGKTHTWEGDATVGLEVPNASAGEWTYTVTALTPLPYDNFPYIVRMGSKD